MIDFLKKVILDEILNNAGADACLQSLHSKIDPSKLAAGAVW